MRKMVRAVCKPTLPAMAAFAFLLMLPSAAAGSFADDLLTGAQELKNWEELTCIESAERLVCEPPNSTSILVCFDANRHQSCVSIQCHQFYPHGDILCKTARETMPLLKETVETLEETVERLCHLNPSC